MTPIRWGNNENMMQALALNKLHYCNSLLMGMTGYNLDKLQKIQNMACRIVLKVRKYDYVSDHLSQLHWLKIRQCIIYKTLMLVFKCKHNLALPSLHGLLSYTYNYHPTSTDQNQLLTMEFNTALVMKSSVKSKGPHL